jgi:hypothetical protein
MRYTNYKENFMRIFGTILLTIITLMHLYVFWRAGSVPLIKHHITTKGLAIIGLIFWFMFLIGRIYGHGATGTSAAILELIGMNWMASLFLIFVCILTADILTGFGLILPRITPSLRGGAILAGVTLSMIAMIQGMRPPVIQNYDVNISGLPPEMDGKVIVALSDLHAGSVIGEKWLADRVAQVQAEKPDLIVLLGDIFEAHGAPLEGLLIIMHRLSAPLGVWAVFGNHESYGHISKRDSMIEADGFKVLVDSWVELNPGLVLAGVDDMTVRKWSGREGDFVKATLAGRPPGTTILLSHSPLDIDKAAQAGVDLMLCGHTHGGQVWPFGYLVKRMYPLFEGLYKIGKMTLIVSRGTGTWGPRMRLWRPGEILKVTLCCGEN